MKIEFLPSKNIYGTVIVPPSKSYLQRAILAAALSCGTCIINGVRLCDDVSGAVDAVRALGAHCEYNGNKLSVIGTGKEVNNNAEIYVAESATLARIVIPVLFAMPKDHRFSVKLGKNLSARPFDEYDYLRDKYSLGYKKESDTVSVRGGLSSGRYEVHCDVSSQYASGMLFALSVITGESELELIPPVVSADYIAMTAEVLNSFGANVVKTDGNSYRISGNGKLLPCDYTAEGDWSSAAYYLLFGDGIDLIGLNDNSLQPDAVCTGLYGRIESGFAKIDVSQCPDLLPALMVMGALNKGVMLTGTDRLKYKESDRANFMITEMQKMGIECIAEYDRLTVLPSEIKAPSDAIDSHNDHRIVMAMSRLLALTGGVIDKAEAVSKSNPAYFDDLMSLRVKMIHRL